MYPEWTTDTIVHAPKPVAVVLLSLIYHVIPSSFLARLPHKCTLALVGVAPDPIRAEEVALPGGESTTVVSTFRPFPSFPGWMEGRVPPEHPSSSAFTSFTHHAPLRRYRGGCGGFDVRTRREAHRSTIIGHGQG